MVEAPLSAIVESCFFQRDGLAWKGVNGLSPILCEHRWRLGLFSVRHGGPATRLVPLALRNAGARRSRLPRRRL